MSWFGHNCLTNGHRYEARYDSTFPDHIDIDPTVMLVISSDMVQALKVRTYVQDVCVRCGDAVKRQD